MDRLIGSTELNPEVLQLYRESKERQDLMNAEIERNSNICQKIKSFEPSQIFDKLDSHQRLIADKIALITEQHQQIELAVHSVM